jgi:hypothetical protein
MLTTYPTCLHRQTRSIGCRSSASSADTAAIENTSPNGFSAPPLPPPHSLRLTRRTILFTTKHRTSWLDSVYVQVEDAHRQMVRTRAMAATGRETRRVATRTRATSRAPSRGARVVALAERLRLSVLGDGGRVVRSLACTSISSLNKLPMKGKFHIPYTTAHEARDPQNRKGH